MEKFSGILLSEGKKKKKESEKPAYSKIPVIQMINRSMITRILRVGVYGKI